jgi:hypothetical protein
MTKMLSIHAVRQIIDQHGHPSDALRRLLDYFSLKHNTTLKSIVQVTQQWLRKPNQERWHLPHQELDQTTPLFSLFKELGLIDEVYPMRMHYEYALVHGGIYQDFTERLLYLIQLWQDGIRVEHLILLGGERPLDNEQDPIALILNPDKKKMPVRSAWQSSQNTPLITEIDMMKMVYDQLDFPQEMHGIPVTFCSTPMFTDSAGNLRRPITGDTIKTWLSTNPKPGSCLFISTQPMVGYQDAVSRTLMPTTFSIETAGVKSAETNILMYLDTIARWLYQENQRINA